MPKDHTQKQATCPLCGNIFDLESQTDFLQETSEPHLIFVAVWVGIKWGKHEVSIDDLVGSGGVLNDNVPDEYEWEPDALLRSAWNGCERCGWTPDQCVGEEYEVVMEDVE